MASVSAPARVRLRDHIAAAHQIGPEPGQRSDGRPDQSCAQFDGQPAQPLRRGERCEQRAIVDDRHEAGDRAEDKIERPGLGRGVVQRFDMKVRRIPEQHARHGDCGRRGAKRRDRNARLEAAHQFLQDENGAGDRRVERGRKAGARAGRQKHSAVGPVAAEHLPDQVGHRRAHLNARALTTERKPRPDRQHAADELDGMMRNGASGSSPFNTAST